MHNWSLDLDFPFFLQPDNSSMQKGKEVVKSSSGFENLADVPTCYKMLVSYLLEVSLVRSCDERTEIQISCTSVLQREAIKKQ